VKRHWWGVCFSLLWGVLLGGYYMASGLMVTDTPTSASSAASRLQLVHADVSRGVVQNGTELRILEGNVHIQQDTLHLYCQKAIYNPRARQMVLTGQVRIIQGKTQLSADKITYWEDTRIAVAEGHVVLIQPGRELQTPYLVYNYETDQTRAEQWVTIKDDSQRVTISAGRGEYLPEQALAYVEHNAHLMQVDSAGTDTLNIFARRLSYYFRPRRKAIASKNVRVLQGKMEAQCDSIVYFLEDSVAVLRVQPRARQEGNLLTGDRIELRLNGTRVDRITVLGNKAHAISTADSLRGWENQLDGKRIFLYLKNGQLDFLEAIQQASSEYYVEDKGEFVGKNVASADTIRVFFKDGQVDSIVVKGGAEGVFEPLEGSAPPVSAENP